MDVALTVICSCLGSAGAFGFIQYLIARHDKKNDELDSIKKDLDSIKNTQQETIIRVTRGELKDLIRDDPENVEAIMQVAAYYFVDLDGNAYLHAIFEKWAKEHDQPTSWLPQLRNERSIKNVKRN